jgi:hypothetical protein
VTSDHYVDVDIVAGSLLGWAWSVGFCLILLQYLI